jgi:hypothetical protein
MWGSCRVKWIRWLCQEVGELVNQVPCMEGGRAVGLFHLGEARMADGSADFCKEAGMSGGSADFCEMKWDWWTSLSVYCIRRGRWWISRLV